MKKIIVIAHKFSPFSGVGANRWTHLSKEIAECGNEVHILTVERGAVPFIHNNIIIHKVKSEPFYKLLTLKFKNKYLSAVYSKVVDKVRTLFWFDDEAQYWGRYLLPVVIDLVHAHSIDTIIATGHPFQSNRWAAEAKKLLGDKVFLIQDIRDPWSKNPFKKYLFKWQKQRVIEWEKDALSTSDANVFVTNGLMNLMSINEDNSYVIENGYSSEYIKKSSNEKRNKNGVIIHAGTLANGRDKVAEPFFSLCLNEPEVLCGNQVHFYGRISLWLLTKYKVLFNEKVFILHNPISQAELVSIYNESLAALQFNAEEYPYLVSTKIYEHPAFGLPTLSINSGGEVSELIESYCIGVSCRPDEESVKKGLNQILSNDYSKYLEVFSSSCTYKNRAIELLSLIEEVKYSKRNETNVNK